MKIAVLYICTGLYSEFWTGFYESCKKYFFTNDEVHYFVFTDSPSINNTSEITKVYKECSGFPMDSLFRFKMFLGIKEELEKFDYTFFFNSNMQFVDYVGDEILPDANENYLTAGISPGYVYTKPSFFPYERNKRSLAYIPYIKGYSYRYYMGGLNGGRSSQFLSLIETCAEWIDKDYSNNIIAIFHDESHLNKYLFDKPVKVLTPDYGTPEGWNFNLKPKIIIRDKVKVNSAFKKGPITLSNRVNLKLKRMYNAIMWRV